MVKDISIKNDQVNVLVALTVAGCPLAKTIKDDVERAVMKLEGVKKVVAETTSMTPDELSRLKANLQQRMGNQSENSGYERSSIERLDKKGIENFIAIVSGKGGVGKSFLTSLLATELRREGYEVGVLDADITGPSIAKVFGLTSRPLKGPNGILPVTTKSGIKVMSLNLLLEDPEKPAIWRGPIVNNLIRQLYMDVDWGDLHYLLVDLPPGTSDAPLTVFQSLPLSGVLIITTPQDLALMIVSKSANMAKTLNIPLLGLVENMAYTVCSHCGEKENIFGPSNGVDIAKKLDTTFLGSLRIDPMISKLSDDGNIEDYSNPKFSDMVRKLRLNLSNNMLDKPQAVPIAWKNSSSDQGKKKFELKQA